MKMQDTTPIVSGGRAQQERLLDVYGDEIWETICDTVPLNNTFRPDDLINTVPCIANCAPKTQEAYIKMVLKNVIEEWKHLSAEEGTPPLVLHKRRNLYRLTKAGE